MRRSGASVQSTQCQAIHDTISMRYRFWRLLRLQGARSPLVSDGAGARAVQPSNVHAVRRDRARDLESIESSTHLIVVRDCDVSAVWRDRNAIEEALRDVHIVFLFPEQQARTNTRSWFLAKRVEMTATGSIFSCVDAADLYKREERVDQPPMKLSMPGDADSQMVTVEASAAVLKRRLEQLRREAPVILAEAAARRAMMDQQNRMRV